jgi:multidrug resistance protein
MLAPGVPLVLEEFNTDNNQVATFVVSAFVLGFALGPLIVAPLSELYGRTIVYHVCNVLFTILTVACALSTSIGMLIAFRFLAGCAGVAVITCGSGTIVDLMPPEKRGGAMSLWSIGPLLGPVVGPVCAGFLVEAKGWRWVFWIIAIAVSWSRSTYLHAKWLVTDKQQAGVATLISFFVFRETYGPELLERKAARLRKETGDSNYQSKLKKEGTPRQVFLVAIVRPARMFAFAPLVTVMCIYVATLYGKSVSKGMVHVSEEWHVEPICPKEMCLMKPFRQSTLANYEYRKALCTSFLPHSHLFMRKNMALTRRVPV